MKFKVINDEPVQFYNAGGELMGTISVSGSGDMIIQPDSGSSRNIILGRSDTVGDVEIGIVSTPVNLSLLGGGTFSSNGNTLNIGSTAGTDTVNLYNVTYSQSLYVTGSVSVTGSVLADNFIGGGLSMDASSSFTGLPTSEPTTTGSLWISGSSVAHPSSSYLMIFNP